MKKGFSVVALIIVIIVLAGLGFGGYYAYNNYVAPMLNPNSAFIPDNLKAYAKGSDADIFIIFNDENRSIKTLLNLLQIPDESNIAMKSGIMIIKNSTKCAAAAYEFETAEKAEKVKELIENAVSSNTDPSLTYKVEQKDTILTVDVNDGFNGLSGNLIDNPLFNNLNMDYLDNELVIAINNKNIPDIASGLLGPLNTISGANYSSFIPTANAQLIQTGDSPALIRSAQPSEPAPGASTIMNPESTILLYTVENTFIYAGIDKLDLSLTLQMKLMDKTTLESSDFFKMIPGADADNFYKKADEVFNKDLNEEFKKAKEKMSSFAGSSEYKDLTVTLKIKFDIKELVTMMFSSLPTVVNAPARGRDAARMGHLNSFVAAIEAFNSDNGKYPEESVCFNEVFKIDAKNYFSGGITPKDPNGSRTFGEITCDDGYYYQYIGGGYVLWAKMEDNSNNNTELTPADIEKLVLSGKMPKYEEEGTFYFLNKIGLIPTADTTTTTKVKRKTTTIPAENTI